MQKDDESRAIHFLNDKNDARTRAICHWTWVFPQTVTAPPDKRRGARR